MVSECIATARFSLLLNGTSFGYFAAGRGLRQGDPLLPALFTLFSDILSRMIAKAEMEGRLSGVKITRASPKITHLMYADDVVIYEKATREEAEEIKKILDQIPWPHFLQFHIKNSGIQQLGSENRSKTHWMENSIPINGCSCGIN